MVNEFQNVRQNFNLNIGTGIVGIDALTVEISILKDQICDHQHGGSIFQIVKMVGAKSYHTFLRIELFERNFG